MKIKACLLYVFLNIVLLSYLFKLLLKQEIFKMPLIIHIYKYERK